MAKAIIRESGRLLEALAEGKSGEKVFKVCLITEGLGNLRNKNFYGPEAIASAVSVYEGKACYINHQALDEEENLPERDVRDKAGYFKNLALEVIDGVKACVGELHCDLSASGRFLAEKIQSAILYKKEFPDNGLEYCGFSVNGDGDAEPREMDINEASMRVNYVNSFTDESESCDLVTTPARGGKAVSVIRESETNPKENKMKHLKKVLETAFSKITESAKKATGEDKKPLLEAAKTLTEALKAVEAEAPEMTEAEATTAFLAKKEGESAEDHVARMKSIKSGVDEMLKGEQDEQGEGVEEADDKGEKDPKVMEARRPAKLSADDLERNILAVKSVIKESGLPEDCYPDTKISNLARMPFSEAKAVIEGDSKLAASILRESGIEPVASLRHTAKTKEAGSRKSAFTESFKKETF